MRAHNDDPLKPVHEWPGSAARYAFLAGSSGSATLQLEVAFDPVQASQAPAALADYTAVQDQLADPRTALAVTTALAAGPVSPATTTGEGLGAALAEFVGAIVASLDPAAPGSPPASIVLTASVPVSHVADIGEDLFPIWVAIEMSRDPDGGPAVTSQLSPRLAPAETQTVALHDWALGFETAFAAFDKSGGLLKVLAGDPSAPGALWALKWSASQGVSVSFANARREAAGAPVYFTRRPLATRLLAGDVEIHDYEPDGTPAARSTTRSFEGIDLDAWGSSFLEAFDRLLAPELVTKIAQLDSDSYTRLIDAQADIANAIASGLSWVFDDQMPQNGRPGAGDLEAARTHFREGLLASLETDLATAAIVQVPATVNVKTPFEAGDPSSPPAELVGTPTGLAPPSQAGVPRTAPATLPIANGTQELSFLAGAIDPADSAALCLELAYHLSGVDLRKQGRASSRLWFLVADEVLHVPMGDLDIPVPLRSYPSPARLVEQSIGAAHDPPATVTHAVEASYALTLTRPSAAQDDLHLALLFNGAPLDHDDLGPLPGTPLFAPLARFLDFQTRYAETALAAIEAGAADAVRWARDVVALVRDVVTGWQAEVQGEQSGIAPAGAGAASPAPLTWDFVLRVPDQTKPNQLLLRWNGGEAVPDAGWPAIEGARGTPAPGGAMAYTLGSSANLIEPTLVWADLSVVTNQSISAAAWIVRNESLAGCGGSQQPRTTNPSLVYRGPAIAFHDPAVPMLEVPGTLTIRSTSLGDAVSQLVNQVMQPLSPEAQVGWGLQVAYSFAPAPGEGEPRTQVPVFQGRASVTTAASPPPGVETPQQFATAVVGALADWHRDFAPSGESAVVLFSVTLFAASGDRPLARLLDVEAPVGQSGWWPT